MECSVVTDEEAPERLMQLSRWEEGSARWWQDRQETEERSIGQAKVPVFGDSIDMIKELRRLGVFKPRCQREGLTFTAGNIYLIIMVQSSWWEFKKSNVREDAWTE